MNKKLNYFFSGWIENAGVVPLFLFSALRFFPMFFFLFDLLFFVTRVFETITNLLKRLRALHLPFLASTVKVMFCLGLILNTSTSKLRAQESLNILIGMGEHREISAKNIKNYTITNPSAISHKHIKQKNHILIKGENSGFGQLVIWKNSGEKKTYQIYVTENIYSKGSLNLAKSLENMNLTLRPLGPINIVEGEIQNFDDYKMMLELKKVFKNELNLNYTRLSREVSKKILTSVYLTFYNNFKDSIKCSVQGIKIICKYEKSDPPPQSDLESLSRVYGVKFIARDSISNIAQNYKVKLKIIQEERLDGRELNFGLDQLSSTVDEIFNNGLSGLVRDNRVILKENKIDVQTIAEPEILVRPNKTAEISIGSEIPFQTGGEYNVINTEWKFAGLKVNLNLNPIGRRTSLDYQMEFSRPTGDSSTPSIGGSRERATTLVNPGEPIRLFQILFQTDAQNKGNVPGIASVPILNKIFGSKSSQSTYKRITGYLLIEKIRMDR